jgi:TatD DNase family protein
VSRFHPVNEPALIDTHAHLASPQLSENLEHYLILARQAGVSGALCVATTAQDSVKCIELAESQSMLRASVGIHPNYCHEASEADWRLVQELARHPKVIAIGETGLDRYWDDCPWETQLDYLLRHIQLSRETDRPIIVHTRDCVDEAVEILVTEHSRAPYSAVMHSFTGSTEAAQRCLDVGFYISFAGMVTFKNSEDLRQVAKRIPQDRILVETDSPYLTPHPFRGQRPNHPALVRHTLECLANELGLAPEKLSTIVTENTMRLFKHWNS